MKTAIIILGHGSRSSGADATVKRVAHELKKSGGFEIVEHAFLQYVQPGPIEALAQCIRQGAQKIVIVPFFMQSGAHVNKNIPELVEKTKKQYPDVEVSVTDFAGSHPLMVKIVQDLVNKR